MSTESPHHVLRPDYDDDPGRWAANQLSTERYLRRSDVHPEVADRLAEEAAAPVLDLGGGNGALARLLAERGVSTVVADAAEHVRRAPRPGVRADACHLPFRDGGFGAAAALYLLYHLDDPRQALLELRRVLRPGALVAVCAPSRYNDPELAEVLPGWGRPLSFDAENGVELLSGVFDSVRARTWDAPLVSLPDHAALTLFLRGRGLAEAAADQIPTPLRVTKRGLLAYARTPAG